MTGDQCCRDCGAEIPICRGCGRPLPALPGAKDGAGAALWFDGRELVICDRCVAERREGGIVRTLARVCFALQQIAKEEIVKARAAR
jgi:hypothetical protein